LAKRMPSCVHVLCRNTHEAKEHSKQQIISTSSTDGILLSLDLSV